MVLDLDSIVDCLVEKLDRPFVASVTGVADVVSVAFESVTVIVTFT